MSLHADMRAWPPEAVEEFEERAGILEYLAKFPKARAEELAERMVRRRWQAGPPAWPQTPPHPRALKRLS